MEPFAEKGEWLQLFSQTHFKIKSFYKSVCKGPGTPRSAATLFRLQRVRAGLSTTWNRAALVAECGGSLARRTEMPSVCDLTGSFELTGGWSGCMQDAPQRCAARGACGGAVGQGQPEHVGGEPRCCPGGERPTPAPCNESGNLLRLSLFENSEEGCGVWR